MKKGQRTYKLNIIQKTLENAGINGLTTNETYLKTGIMRPTIDRYFELLKKNGKLIEIQKGSAKIRINPKAAYDELKNILEQKRKKEKKKILN